MSVSDNNPNLPEYIHFIDPHLKIIILDFYLSKNTGNNENILKQKKQELFKTYLFDQQKKFLDENKSLSDENDYQLIEKNKEKLEKDETEIKEKIIGFLNLLEQCRNINDYDTSTSMNKKIVYFI